MRGCAERGFPLMAESFVKQGFGVKLCTAYLPFMHQNLFNKLHFPDILLETVKITNTGNIGKSGCSWPASLAGFSCAASLFSKALNLCYLI